MATLDTSVLMNAISRESQRDDSSMESVVERFRSDEFLEVPLELTDLELWGNYMNDDLYEMDKKIREFLKRTRYKRQVNNGYRTTASMVFAWIYGRQPEPKDGTVCRLIHTLLKYYCTSYTGRTTFNGKPVERVYRFSKYAASAKRPYSLRLRIEEQHGVTNRATFREGPDSRVDKRHAGRDHRRED